VHPGLTTLLVAGLLLLSPATANADNAPRWLRLSWAGSDASESMAITWNTDTCEATTWVQHGPTPALGIDATGTAFQGNGGLGCVHEVELLGLAPQATHHYRVGEPGNWSPVHTFTTGPVAGCGPTSFVVLGDNRSQDNYGPAPQWPDIYAHALESAPDFVIDTGDIVKDGKETLQWINYLHETAELLPLAPHLPSLGNHDEDLKEGDYANYNQVFQLPRNEVTGTEDYYYFTHGDAIFVALSTSTWTGGTLPFQAQADWLDQVLTENPRTWKFVYFHHPIFTSYALLDLILDEIELNHPPNEKNQNPALLPVIDKHHVDIVFSGHNHFYERFSPMTAGTDPTVGVPAPSPSLGTTYITTGGAGAFTYDEVDLAIVEIDLTDDLICSSQFQAVGSQICSGRHHFVRVSIDGSQLTGEVIATAAQNFSNDEANVEVLDTFSIVKPVPTVDCSASDEEETPDGGDTAQETGDIVGEADGEDPSEQDAAPTDDATEGHDSIDSDSQEDSPPSPDSGGETTGSPDKPSPGDSSSREGDTAPGESTGDAPQGETIQSAGDDGCRQTRAPSRILPFALLLLALQMYRRARKEGAT
jgi:hypothetical protein